MVAVSASSASSKILKGAVGLIKAVEEHIYDVGREIRSALGTANPAQAQALPKASMTPAVMTSVLVVSCGEESTDHLIWRLSSGAASLGGSSTPSLSDSERCKFLAVCGEDDSVCKPSSDDVWKKLEEQGAVLNKSFSEMKPDGLLRVVRAPSLGGGPPTGAAGENQIIKEMLSKVRETREMMREKLQDLVTGDKDVTWQAFEGDFSLPTMVLGASKILSLTFCVFLFRFFDFFPPRRRCLEECRDGAWRRRSG